MFSFSNLGNLGDIFKKTQELQKNFEKKLEERKQKMFTGEAGAGLVTVQLNGLFDCLDVQIDPSLLQEAEKTSLQELLKGAYNAAGQKVKADLKEDLQNSFGAFQNFLPG